MNVRNPETVPVKSVKKALDLLSILLFDDPQGKGIRLKVLSEKLGISVKTAHNLLKTMVHCGFVEKDGFGNYTTGNSCRKIAYRNQTATCQFQSHVTDVILKHVRKLREGMTYILLEKNVWTTFVNIGPKLESWRMTTEPVRRFYLYETATGRVLFSFSPPEQQSLLAEENGTPDIYWPRYADESEQIRRQGFCMFLRTRYRTFSYSVPVFDPDGGLAGALGVYVLPEHVNPQRNRLVLTHLKAAAKEISGFWK